jgi:hypothetical protein
MLITLDEPENFFSTNSSQSNDYRKWNGRRVTRSEQSFPCAQVAIQDQAKISCSQKIINPEQNLTNEIQEILQASEKLLREQSIEDLFDDLDTTDPVIGTSKRDTLVVAEMIQSAAKTVCGTIEQIFGTIGSLFSSVVICMALQSAKQVVIDELLSIGRISPRDHRLIQFSETGVEEQWNRKPA